MFKTSYSLVETSKKYVEIVKIWLNQIDISFEFFYRLLLKVTLKKTISSTPGIEPGPAGWKPAILAIRPRGTSYKKWFIE